MQGKAGTGKCVFYLWIADKSHKVHFEFWGLFQYKAITLQLVPISLLMIARANRAQSVDWRAISRNNWAGRIFCPFPASKVRPWIVIRHQHGAAMDGLCENSDIKRALQMRPSLSKVSDLPLLHCPLLECTALQVTGLHCKVLFYIVP